MCGLADQAFPASHPALGQPVDELALSEIKGAILAKLRLAIGKDAGMATKHDWYMAAALALRDRIVHRWLSAEKRSYDAGSKRVYYLSLEFLIGRLFSDALNNMGLLAVFEAALGDLGVGLSELRKCEPDAALGNGGLGRLAACFMESMATLAIPAIGYGIRYDFGLLRQIIAQGWQQEYPDEWLSFGNPWEFQREVIDPLAAGVVALLFRRQPAVHDAVAQRQRSRLVPVMLGRHAGVLADGEPQLGENGALDLRQRQLIDRLTLRRKIHGI